MNILIIANTPFQIITSIQLKSTVFKDSSVDLIISDNIAQYETLSQSIRDSGIFNIVCTIESKEIKWQSWKYTLLHWFFRNNIRKRLPFLHNKQYQWFLFANTGGVAECIATYLNLNRGTMLAMYEDGFVSYSDFYKNEIEDAIHPQKLTSKLIYFFRKRAVAYLKNYYVYNPNLLSEWNFDFIITKIAPIDKQILPILNSAFGLTETSLFKYRYIFFEESYFADNNDIGDKFIVDEIARIVGKENLLIKLHPRNPIDRFVIDGYYTNSITSIPWEVIALNLDLSNTILITISSGSSITSYSISGQKALKSIMLYEMEGLDRSKLTPSLHVFDKICKHDKYFIFPQTFIELKNVLRRFV